MVLPNRPSLSSSPAVPIPAGDNSAEVIGFTASALPTTSRVRHDGQGLVFDGEDPGVDQRVRMEYEESVGGVPPGDTLNRPADATNNHKQFHSGQEGENAHLISSSRSPVVAEGKEDLARATKDLMMGVEEHTWPQPQLHPSTYAALHAHFVQHHPASLPLQNQHQHLPQYPHRHHQHQQLAGPSSMMSSPLVPSPPSTMLPPNHFNHQNYMHIYSSLTFQQQQQQHPYPTVPPPPQTYMELASHTVPSHGVTQQQQQLQHNTMALMSTEQPPLSSPVTPTPQHPHKKPRLSRSPSSSGSSSDRLNANGRVGSPSSTQRPQSSGAGTGATSRVRSSRERRSSTVVGASRNASSSSSPSPSSSSAINGARAAPTIAIPPPSKSSSSALLTPSQKKANHIQSEQKRRANIRRGYETLCLVVPALREAIDREDGGDGVGEDGEEDEMMGMAGVNGLHDDAKRKGKKGRVSGSTGNGASRKRKADGGVIGGGTHGNGGKESRAGPKSEGIVLGKTIEYINALLGERDGLLQRLEHASGQLPVNFPTHPNPIWEKQWTGGTGMDPSIVGDDEDLE